VVLNAYGPFFSCNKFEFFLINLQVDLLSRVRLWRQAWAWMRNNPNDPKDDRTLPDTEGKTGVGFCRRFPLCSSGK
jgi:hypothetical protein